MLFSELYSSYYRTVAEILKLAVRGELDEKKLRSIVSEKAFGESIVTIPDAMKSGKWQLVTPDYRTPIRHEPSMPMTTLEKRWLKAISLDPRIKLFDFKWDDLSDIEPLFTPSDYCIYDRYADGDDFGDSEYIRKFRIIVRAIKNGKALRMEVANRNGRTVFVKAFPKYLEYSEKDDKFRLIVSGCRYRSIIKVSSILSCVPFEGKGIDRFAVSEDNDATVSFALLDARNTLERAMLHFAHFEKTAVRLDDNKYQVTVNYRVGDETEMLIRILSFGQFIKVTEPESFVNLIRERLKKQKKCGLQ